MEGARFRVLITLALVVVACGEVSEAEAHPCTPSSNLEIPLNAAQNAQKQEDIIYLLTGERQTGDEDYIELTTAADPNFAGVWGESQGGIVVAVPDCSIIDVDEIARIAGGSGDVRIIEVPFTFSQVDVFADSLISELESLGVDWNVSIYSTSEGRLIEVQVPDLELLPDAFGSSVPTRLLTVTDDYVDESPDPGS